jgi:RNA polymerase sigma-70 factor, ECF subfamily
LSRGDQGAMEKLLPLVYPEMHAIAQRYFRRERRDHTLQPTALVHEAYVRLLGQQNVDWQSRAHFLSVASIAMRRVLVDYARSHHARKRPGSGKVELDDAMMISEQRSDELLAIDEALTRLAAMDAKQARVVELRFFGGMSVEESAEALGIGTATVKRYWNSARAWLITQVKVTS